MKKIISMILSSVLLFGCLTMASGCKTGEKAVKDAKTINVRVYKAGFGDLFIYDLKKEFEQVYEDEGYKVNIMKPSSGSSGTAMVQEMSRGYAKTQIDLYVTGAIMPNQVSAEGGEYGEVCEDLEELVFKKTAIGYDGKESEKTIEEMLSPDLVPFLRADNGTMYGIPWAQTSAGVVVNTKKLAAYGITELPRTTDEMFEIFDMIYDGANGIPGSEKSKTYPITYNLSVDEGGAASYQNVALLNWFAQYDVDAYNQFLRMQDRGQNGWTNMEEGYKVFDNPNLKDVLEAGYQLMDMKYSADGSAEQDLDQAQGLIMKDANGQNNAVFMLNGDWFLNEVKANYPDKLHDIAFMNVPIISALGVQLFGANTAYGLSDDQSDELLSYICKLVDENKSVDEIVELVESETGITLAREDAQKVATARGVCFSRGIEHLSFITKGSTKKDIAALFIRMIASKDFAETFMEKANGSSPYATDISTESEYAFVNQAQKLVSNVHFRAINSRVEGLRFRVMKSDYMFPNERNLALTLYSKAKNTSYESAATNLYNASLQSAIEKWNEYVGSRK